MIGKGTPKIKTIIFSYERKEMLLSLIDEVKMHDYIVFDDGSKFKLDQNFIQFPHGGRSMFWKIWDSALKSLKGNDHDIFLFIQSDFKNVDFDQILTLHKRFGRHAYVVHLSNDGRTVCWTGVAPKRIDETISKVGFCDCSFFCNKKTLDKLGYFMRPINPNYFKNKAASSGVGSQISHRMLAAAINIYLPDKSVAYHGNHPSLMHPTERKKNPLISKK